MAYKTGSFHKRKNLLSIAEIHKKITFFKTFFDYAERLRTCFLTLHRDWKSHEFLKAIFERLFQTLNKKYTMTDAVVKCQRHRQAKVMECYKENRIL